MTRTLFTAATLLALAPAAAAQDMPLSQILIDGEGWKKAEGKPEKPKAGPALLLDRVATHSPDRTTLFLALPRQRSLFAASLDRDGTAASPAAAYAPLRTRRGEKSIEVTGLATDRDGRIYAATEMGVQVFDPTGRLCGVLTPAAAGRPEHLAFEGDRLTLWVGGTKYTRGLNTAGVK